MVFKKSDKRKNNTRSIDVKIMIIIKRIKRQF
jgi:hypothetical protein